MADFSSRPQLAKISLGIGGFFFAVLVVCFVVGGTLFIQEHYKVSHYTKDSCRVRSASYEIISSCSKSGTGPEKCYAPVWQVDFGQNGTRKGTLRSKGDKILKYVLIASEKYKVGSSYPCWYNTQKSAELTWYEPSTYYPLILLIIGAVAVPFAIISCVVFCRLRERPDL